VGEEARNWKLISLSKTMLLFSSLASKLSTSSIFNSEQNRFGCVLNISENRDRKGSLEGSDSLVFCSLSLSLPPLITVWLCFEAMYISIKKRLFLAHSVDLKSERKELQVS